MPILCFLLRPDGAKIIEIDLEKNHWTGTITVHYSQPMQVLTGDRTASEKAGDATKAYRFK